MGRAALNNNKQLSTIFSRNLKIYKHSINSLIFRSLAEEFQLFLLKEKLQIKHFYFQSKLSNKLFFLTF